MRLGAVGRSRSRTPRESIRLRAVSLWHGEHDGGPGRGTRARCCDRRRGGLHRTRVASSPRPAAGRLRHLPRLRPGGRRGSGGLGDRVATDERCQGPDPRSAVGWWQWPRTRPAGRCGRVAHASTRSRSATSSSKGCPTCDRTPWPMASPWPTSGASSTTLDPTDRALIALRYVAELSSDEIGRALGMSSSGARGRLSRLLLRLRGELRDA